MPLIQNGYAGSTRRSFLGALVSALSTLGLFDRGAAVAQRSRDEIVSHLTGVTADT